MTAILVILALVIGFGVGLLVGRKNPSLADAAAKLANSAKDQADAAIAKARGNHEG